MDERSIDDIARKDAMDLSDSLPETSDDSHKTHFEGKPIFLADPERYDEMRLLTPDKEDQDVVEEHRRVLEEVFDNVACTMEIGSIDTVESIEFWVSPVNQLTDGRYEFTEICDFTDEITDRKFQVLKKVPFESPV